MADTSTIIGNVSDLDALPQENIEIRIELSLPVVFYKTDTQIVGNEKTVLTDVNGDWTVDLVETANMADNAFYIFKIKEQEFKKQVPVSVVDLNFTELPDVVF